MALIRCPDCRRSISDSAAACPNCGRPITQQDRSHVSAPILSRGTVKFLLVLAAVALGARIVETLTGSSAPVAQGTALAPAPPRTVPYRVVDRWPIPNGGYGQIIVIEPKDATDGGLRALGEELTYDTRGDRNAFIQVFSAQRAALMRKSGSLEALSRKDGAFYDDHTVGSYTRNANTGENVFTITPKGLNGPEADLKYQDRDSTA